MMAIRNTPEDSPDSAETGRRFVSLPIPEEYVTRVMAYVGALDEDATPPPAEPSVPAPTPLADARVAAWSNEDLARLASGQNFTTRILGEVMDVLADRPGEWMDTTTLAQAIEKDRKTVKGIWTHVGRHIKSQYSDRPWPLDAKWGPQIDSDRPAVTFYRLSPEQAKRWKAVR